MRRNIRYSWNERLMHVVVDTQIQSAQNRTVIIFQLVVGILYTALYSVRTSLPSGLAGIA